VANLLRSSPLKIGVRFIVAIVVLLGAAFAWRQYARAQVVFDLPTATARKGDFPVLIHCRGALTARRSVQVAAPTGVQELQIIWLAPPGSEVKIGQSIIRFDRSKLEQQLQEKSAALKQAQSTLDQAVAQSRMRADQDKVDLETARYEMERARLEASKAAIVSAMEGEKSTIDFGLKREKVQLQLSATNLHEKSDEAKNQSLLRLRDEAQAEVSRFQERLVRMDMKSPSDGVINYLTNMSQGWQNAQSYKVGDHAPAGAPIADIPDLSSLEMESKVEEIDRGRLSPGQAVRVHIDAFPEKVFDAKLISISSLTEQSFEDWPPTRTFRAFARFAALDSRLRPGMNAASDTVERKIPNAISIPVKALFTRQGQPIVYLKSAQGYIPTSVRLIARNTDEAAVSGIAAGSLVTLTEPLQAKP
jgi:HlyD family secretion protein